MEAAAYFCGFQLVEGGKAVKGVVLRVICAYFSQLLKDSAQCILGKAGQQGRENGPVLKERRPQEV